MIKTRKLVQTLPTSMVYSQPHMYNKTQVFKILTISYSIMQRTEVCNPDIGVAKVSEDLETNKLIC